MSKTHLSGNDFQIGPLPSIPPTHTPAHEVGHNLPIYTVILAGLFLLLYKMERFLKWFLETSPAWSGLFLAMALAPDPLPLGGITVWSLFTLLQSLYLHASLPAFQICQPPFHSFNAFFYLQNIFASKHKDKARFLLLCLRSYYIVFSLPHFPLLLFILFQ